MLLRADRDALVHVGEAGVNNFSHLAETKGVNQQ